MTASDNLPKITVIIVVRNAADTIATALDSVVAQHYPNLEVIVWDGLSTDGTVEVVKKYSYIVTRLESKSDEGPGDAYNRAAKLATGDYIGLLNGDDVYEPGALWTVADYIITEKNPDVVTAGMIFYAITKKGEKIIKGYYADKRQLELTLDNALKEIPTFTLSRFLKRSLFCELEYNTDKNLWYVACDREWSARLSLLKVRNSIIPKGLYGHTINNKGLSNGGNYLRIIDEHILIADMLLARSGLQDPERSIINAWRNKQLVFGFWTALSQANFSKAIALGKEGVEKWSWQWVLLCAFVPMAKAGKKLGLLLSNGIDRGVLN